MNAAQGILTARGGMTSHAALVARQMGKVCVVGCGELDIDYRRQQHHGRGQDHQARAISSRIDGITGEVFVGRLETAPPEVLQVLLDKS